MTSSIPAEFTFDFALLFPIPFSPYPSRTRHHELTHHHHHRRHIHPQHNTMFTTRTPALRTLARRAVRPATFSATPARRYASSLGHFTSASSDLPWLIGAVVFTVPAVIPPGPSLSRSITEVSRKLTFTYTELLPPLHRLVDIAPYRP